MYTYRIWNVCIPTEYEMYTICTKYVMYPYRICYVHITQDTVFNDWFEKRQTMYSKRDNNILFWYKDLTKSQRGTNWPAQHDNCKKHEPIK